MNNKYRRLTPIFLLVFALVLGGGAGCMRQRSSLPGEAVTEQTWESGSEDSESLDSESLESGSSGSELPELQSLESADLGSPSSPDASFPGGSAISGTVIPTPDTLTVYVCGAVQYPGVYVLQTDRRVIDALEAAGGFTEEADTEYWNLAETLVDGEQIRIPTKEESESLEPRETWAGAPGTTQKSQRSDGSSGTGDSNQNMNSNPSSNPVNLNTADVTELMTLPGIGLTKAEAIVAYRDSCGPFRSIEEVMNVAGIKEASFNKIKESITV